MEGSIPTGSTCPYAFSDTKDHDIHIQCALSWEKVVSGSSVTAVSLNVGGGFRLIKPGKKLCMFMQHTEVMCLIWFHTLGQWPH